MARTIEIDDILSHFDSPELLSDEGWQKVVYTIDLPQHGRSLLKIGSYSSESSLRRIQREVEILRELNSAYFPQNYDFVIVDQNRYFILEDYIDGGTLAKKLEDYSDE